MFGITKVMDHAKRLAAEHITGWTVGGLIAVLSGFSPEEWVAHLAARLRLTSAFKNQWPPYLDLRAVVVAVGMAVIVIDSRRRTQIRRTSAMVGAKEAATNFKLGEKLSRDEAAKRFESIVGDDAKRGIEFLIELRNGQSFTGHLESMSSHTGGYHWTFRTQSGNRYASFADLRQATVIGDKAEDPT